MRFSKRKIKTDNGPEQAFKKHHRRRGATLQRERGPPSPLSTGRDKERGFRGKPLSPAARRGPGHLEVTRTWSSEGVEDFKERGRRLEVGACEGGWCSLSPEFGGSLWCRVKLLWGRWCSDSFSSGSVRSFCRDCGFFKTVFVVMRTFCGGVGVVRGLDWCFRMRNFCRSCGFLCCRVKLLLGFLCGLGFE